MYEFNSISTKETFKAEIESSRSIPINELLYEFADDYSYSNADHIGFHIYKEYDESENCNKYYLVTFMDKGPESLELLNKLLQWRKSGLSSEIGHQGGGNKRCIYGHYSNNTCLISRLNEFKCIKAETKPNDIYNLSKSNISEEEFRKKSDSSLYIKTSEEFNIKDMPSWYHEYYDKHKSMSPNWMIRMDINIDEHKDYTDKSKFIRLINKFSMKNYNIPIYFKNELIEDEDFGTNFEKFENIDMMGINHNIDKLKLELYFNDKKNAFLKYNDKYYNCNDLGLKKMKFSETAFSNDADNLIYYGNILLYKIENDYFKSQMKILNEDNHGLTEEYFYGTYILLNGKQTNYCPLEGKLLGQSKDNKISYNHGSTKKSCNSYRFVLEPKCDNDTLNKLIVTQTVKAKTHFRNDSNYKNIIGLANKIYKYFNDEPLTPSPEPIIVDGCNYIYSFGTYNTKEYGMVTLCKYGLVENYKKNEKKRFDTHKRESKKYVKIFIGEDIEQNICKHLWRSIPHDTEHGFEEQISNIIKLHSIETKNDKIQLVCRKGSIEEHREFFLVKDKNYFRYKVLKDINIAANQIIEF